MAALLFLAVILTACLAASPAYADPISVGGFLLGVVGAGGIGGTVIAGTLTVAGLVGSLALTAASIGLNLLIAGLASKPSLPKPENGKQALRQATPPRISGVGRARIAGAYMLYEVDAAGNSWDALALHSGRIGGIVQHYLNDDKPTLDGDGIVTAVEISGDEDDDEEDGRYLSGNVQIKSRLGAATETAYAEAVAALPTIWTAGHRGDGIASLLVKCKSVKADSFSKIYPRGRPEASVVADLSPVFDPRDPAQSLDDPLTWQVSANPVINFIFYITDVDHGGMGLPWADVIAPNLDALMEEADLCDEIVDKAGGGTEPRYSCGGFWYHNTDPAEVIAAFLASCDGWMGFTGEGALALEVGVYRAPTIFFGARDVLSISVDHGEPDEQAINEITWTYTSPEHDYTEVPGDPLRDEDDISLRGRIRSTARPLTFVQSHDQGRRLIDREMKRLATPLKGVIELTMIGIDALGHRWLGIDLPGVAGLGDAVIEARRVKVDLMAGTVAVEFILVDPETVEDYVADDSGGTPAPVALRLARPKLPKPDNPDAELVGVTGGGFTVVFSFDDPLRDELSYVLRYRIVGVTPGPWAEAEISDFTSDGLRVSLTTPVVPSDEDMEFQAAAVGARGSRGEWSDGVVILTQTLRFGALKTEAGAYLKTESGLYLIRES